jgi:hypothetical protein
MHAITAQKGSLYRSHAGRTWRRGHRIRRRVVVTLAVVLVAAVVGAGVWVAVRGFPVRTHLVEAGQSVRELQRRLEAGDVVGARSTLAVLRDQASAARSDTEGLDWRLGGALPGIGADLAAVRTVAAVLDDLSQQVLPAMVDLAGGIDPARLAPSGGRVDVGPLRAAAPRIAALDVAVRAAADRIAAIPTGDLVAPLRTAVDEFAGGLNRLRALTGTVARAAALLPGMLGTSAPRTYLVVFQNLSEVRATGGIAGAFVVLRADRGELRIVDQGMAASVLPMFDRPVLPLDPAMEALYTDRLGIFPADVNATPHFPTAAALLREMYRRRTGTTVDGVFSADPVALSYVLAATGPLTMPEGPALTSGNAVRLLLTEAYARTTSLSDTVDKDAYFATAARTVFDALTRGVADPRAAIGALARAAGERRLLVWSADPAEEAELSGTVLEGALPVHDGTRPVVGVFLNDGTGAKLGYYLTHDASLEVTGCRTDGRRELRLRVTLGSTAPPTGLPAYVLGIGLAGDPYTVRTNVAVYSPAGGAVVDTRLDGAVVPTGAGRERRRGVAVVTVDLRPGQTRTIEASLLTESIPAGGRLTTSLWLTPGVNPWRTNVSSTRDCPGLS